MVLGRTATEPLSTVETFPNPGVTYVEMEQTEFTALCPVTGQPDYGKVIVTYWPKDHCIESKSLKLYLLGFRNRGAFTEALAVEIADNLQGTINPHDLTVKVIQAPRGGISISAVKRVTMDGQKG